jgi:hypothetical protein
MHFSGFTRCPQAFVKVDKKPAYSTSDYARAFLSVSFHCFLSSFSFRFFSRHRRLPLTDSASPSRRYYNPMSRVTWMSGTEGISLRSIPRSAIYFLSSRAPDPNV